jgi:Arf-GAP/coiled-coil/ANK repeat/PH domain-containing protein
MSYPLHHLEDTPNWEVGLKVHEQENKWLIREFDAVSRAYGHYARSLSPTGPFAGGGFGGDAAGVVDGIGGMLGGVLAGMESLATGVAADDSDADDEPRAPRGFNQPSEAAFAAALERVGTVAASEDDEMAAPMAAAVGAPLLGPIADALRAVGTCRESLGRRVRDVSLTPLRQFIDEDLREVAQLRDHYDHKKAACERAREHYLSRTTELARGKAQDELTAAKENLEAARARLALAACNVEGRRRYVLLESARETMQALHRFFVDAAKVTSSLEDNLREIEEYSMASRAQAEMRMLQASRRMEATFGVTDREQASSSSSPTAQSAPGDGDIPGDDGDVSSAVAGAVSKTIAERWEKDAPSGAWGPRAWKPKNEREVSVSPSPSSQNLPGMSQGRSADAAIRKSLLEGATEGSRLGSRAIRRGYLLQRNANHRFSGWTRRYFVLDSLGRLVAHTPIEPRWKRPGGKKPEDEEGADETNEGGHHGLMGTAVKGIAGGIGAVWHAVRQNAAPEPEATGAQSPAEAVVNLRLSCVKPGADEGDKSVAGRPHCFRIISPSHTLLMQAESEEEMNAWLSDLQGVIAELISMNAPGDTQATPGRGDANASAAEREERRGTGRSEDGAGVDPGQRSMRRLRRRRPRLGFAQPLRRDMPEVRGDTQAPRRARLQGEVARAGQGRVDAARAGAVQVDRQRRRQRRVRSREAKSFDVDEEESEREAGDDDGGRRRRRRVARIRRRRRQGRQGRRGRRDGGRSGAGRRGVRVRGGCPRGHHGEIRRTRLRD